MPLSMSPLAQGRGLKHRNNPETGEVLHVAPRAGAWIETKSATSVNGFSPFVLVKRLLRL